jgi:Kef-type K+ transport system membrane component KefB
MFVAGSHVPLRDDRLRRSVGRGLLRAGMVAAVSVAAGAALSTWFGTRHPALYAVVVASSSAALVLPLVESEGLTGPDTLDLLAQVAMADTVCIVALPLVIDPGRAGTAALGALAVVGAGTLTFVLLRQAERSGARRRLHRLSEQRKFAMELRISLLTLFLLAALARASRVSVMLAGFVLGLAVTAVGEPRRLARQLFALTEGFFAPLFYVWIGSVVDLRAIATHPRFLALGAALGAAAVLAHAAMGVTRQPPAYGVLAAAQLGVPVAAVTLGVQRHLLSSGEAAALLLSAVVTMAAATGAAARLGRDSSTCEAATSRVD